MLVYACMSSDVDSLELLVTAAVVLVKGQTCYSVKFHVLLSFEACSNLFVPARYGTVCRKATQSRQLDNERA